MLQGPSPRSRQRYGGEPERSLNGPWKYGLIMHSNSRDQTVSKITKWIIFRSPCICWCRGLLGAALIFSIPGQAVRADPPGVSAERARAARAAGLIQPLAELLKMIADRYYGDIIEADLHEMNGEWVYEFELLPSDGRIFEIYVDAGNGHIISTKGRVQPRP